MLARDLYDLLAPRASVGCEAFRQVDALFDAIIAALRRDPRLATIPRAELDLLLADLRRDTADRWFRVLVARLDLYDTVAVIAARVFGEDADSRDLVGGGDCWLKEDAP